MLPGFTCVCGIFNGFEKEVRTICRSCGIPAPKLSLAEELDIDFKRLEQNHRQALANLTSVQERCTALLNENRALKARLAGSRERLYAAFSDMTHEDGGHGHGDGRCAAENEGLYCCVEPKHPWFEKLLDHLVTALGETP